MSARKALGEALQRCVSAGLTFAAFRVPGCAPELWAQRTPELETLDGSLLWELNGAFLVGPYHLDPERVPFIRSDVELSFGELAPDIEELWSCTGTGRPGAGSRPPTTEASFLSAVGAAVDRLRNGDLEKVVLSRVLSAPFGEDRAVDLFLRGLDAHPQAMVALVATPVHGLWLGASPERLLAQEDDRVEVDALAATMAAGEAPDDPAAWGAKERHEQDVVARAVRAALGGPDEASLVIAGPEVIRRGPVAHLRSRIAMELGERALSDVLLALHPTPAVCGWPRDVAAALIEELEGHERALYAGFWGPWNPDGRTDLYVNLRCMRFAGDHALLFAGAGLTAGSEPAREWDETANKAGTWLRLAAEQE